jgi:hypothetical protein
MRETAEWLVPIRSASCCWVSPSWAARRARRSASGGASAGGKAARGARGRGTSGKSRRWLFGDLFRGRRDVFPQRWARRGSARSGYAPVTGIGDTTYAIIVLDSNHNTIRQNVLRAPQPATAGDPSSKGGIALCRASGNTIERKRDHERLHGHQPRRRQFLRGNWPKREHRPPEHHLRQPGRQVLPRKYRRRHPHQPVRDQYARRAEHPLAKMPTTV